MPIAAETPRLSCGGCPIYEHRPVAAEAAERGAPVGGVCHLMPDAVRKMPNDWCAQHPAFRDWVCAQREVAEAATRDQQGK